MPAPKTVAVEVLSDASSHWIIRTPGRRYPALVVQGDTFHGLAVDLECLAAELEQTLGRESPLAQEARAIAESVRERVDDYEDVLRAAGQEPPYPADRAQGT